VVAGLALLAVHPAVATPNGADAGTHRAAPAAVTRVVPGNWCQVDVGLANYRETPDGRILGQLSRGHWVWEYGWDDGWYVVDVEFGRSGVWMHHSVLGPPCGD
jgi:hypothetical protein